MKMRGASLLLLAMLYLTLASIPAVGGEILYSNGPVIGTINAWTISTLPFDFGGTIHDPGHAVSDSFTLTAPLSDVESVHFFAWTFVEDFVLTVNWSIGTTPFGTDYTGPVSAAVTDTLLPYNGGCCDIHEDSFTFPSIDLPAGTYWLTLSAGVAGGPFGPHGAMWDQNSGPSLAYTINTLNPIPSEAFYIDGTVIPEPSSIMLFGSGLLGLAGVLRRKLF